MVRKILKIIGMVVGSIIILLLAYLTKAYISTVHRGSNRYDVTLQALEIPHDSASLALGARLVKAKACVECHGENLAGKILIDDPGMGLLPTANLTRGKGGRPGDYGAEDWILALKHGLRRDRTPLIFMPSHEFTMLSEKDMGAIIAYCGNLPPVDNILPELHLGPIARILGDLDKLVLFPAEKIDHTRPLVHEVKAEISVAYGKYLSTPCQGCHRETMKGGDPVAPGFPQVADITSTGNPGKWSDEQFIETLRTGVTPEGKVLNPEEMPWTITKEFTELELRALHLYLKSL